MNKSVRIRLEPATFQRLKKLAAAKKCTLSEAALFCLAGLTPARKVLTPRLRNRKPKSEEFAMCHFCTINFNTRREAVSAQGRASQEAGSAQGREDRGKTHTEARPILFGIQPQVYHLNPHGDPIPEDGNGNGGAE